MSVELPADPPEDAPDELKEIWGLVLAGARATTACVNN